MNDPIVSFRGEYSFLSNFARFDTPMIYGKDKLVFITNEHFYQAMKTTVLSERKMIAGHPSKGLKKLGKSVTLRHDWDLIKDEVMYHGLKYKFSEFNPNLQELLLSTGDRELIEGNWWGDKYWGVCSKTGEGENRLGKLLMEIRSVVEYERSKR